MIYNMITETEEIARKKIVVVVTVAPEAAVEVRTKGETRKIRQMRLMNTSL